MSEQDKLPKIKKPTKYNIRKGLPKGSKIANDPNLINSEISSGKAKLRHGAKYPSTSPTEATRSLTEATRSLTEDISEIRKAVKEADISEARFHALIERAKRGDIKPKISRIRNKIGYSSDTSTLRKSALLHRKSALLHRKSALLHQQSIHSKKPIALGFRVVGGTGRLASVIARSGISRAIGMGGMAYGAITDLGQVARAGVEVGRALRYKGVEAIPRKSALLHRKSALLHRTGRMKGKGGKMKTTATPLPSKAKVSTKERIASSRSLNDINHSVKSVIGNKPTLPKEMPSFLRIKKRVLKPRPYPTVSWVNPYIKGR